MKHLYRKPHLSKMYSFLLPLLLTTTQVYTRILRLPCGAYANFSIKKDNTKLQSVFSTIHSINADECKQECVLAKKCRSISTNADQRICELNFKTTEKPYTNAIAITTNGWTYYTTSFDERSFGHNCVQNLPCHKSLECHDQCDCPGYKCIGRNCLDWYVAGARKNGLYFIKPVSKGEPFQAYCDFQSEENTAWTLVMSYALSEKTEIPFLKTKTNNKYKPNWSKYRLSRSMMRAIKKESTDWRSTCQFPNYAMDYRDYVRARFEDFDIMTFNRSGICKKVEYINIRGHTGKNVTASFWQNDQIPLHTDSTVDGCQFNATSGTAGNEDNFGHYKSTNRAFRCTESNTATTQYWFGGEA